WQSPPGNSLHVANRLPKTATARSSSPRNRRQGLRRLHNGTPHRRPAAPTPTRHPPGSPGATQRVFLCAGKPAYGP
ncbi:hypothetical protein NYY89_19890, partial [Acinetobacter baumannii]|nr:hypothetical protein [Acinetobacter baumannii]